DLGRESVYQELRRCAGLSNSRSTPPAWKRLSVPSTVTYTYDTAIEPRGLPTKLMDSVAGSFEAAYDADGGVTTEKLPGGYPLTHGRSTTGNAVARTYTRDSDGMVVFADRSNESVHGQLTTRAGWSDQPYTYDAVGRLTTVADTAETVCTRRSYGFGTRSNRTSLTTASGAPGVDCPAGGGTVKTSAYDSADRLVDAGYTYDAFGRTTAAPGHGSLAYYANDLAYQQTVSGQRQTRQLDAKMRFRSWKTDSGSGSTWTQTGSKVNHYDSDTDNPRWITEDAAGTVTRYVEPVTGGLAATTSKTGGTVLQITDSHGDVALQLPLDSSQAPVALDNDEYGNPRAGQTKARYGWLGNQQRSSETLTGLTLLGVRLYDPSRGRFLQSDPVYGGSANAYDYANADPCNASDSTGMSPNCGKRRIKNGYGMRIIIQRAGGGMGHDIKGKGAYPYIGYYINVQVMGFANRFLSKSFTYGEAWGSYPGRGKAQKLYKMQQKGSWQNRAKIGWAVHFKVKVRPGSRVWAYGAVVVLGWRGYAADMSYSCNAKT
ncbi:RHS repeat-associated core domain-containing protein, partial [Streptomyces sp. NPDC007076]|uniref:RHS repeat-associated core domain-containing protein n=1 Tax=unclassified Streptomyces TaxID=2593676 RepID=UPI0033C6F0AA